MLCPLRTCGFPGCCPGAPATCPVWEACGLVGVQQRDEHEGVETGEAEHLGDEHAPLERVGEQSLQAAGRFDDEGTQAGGQ